MILKILQMKEEKEVSLETPVAGLPQLKIEINKFVKVDENSFLLSFIDIDDEQIEIQDEYDFEYMMEQGDGIPVIQVAVNPDDVQDVSQNNLQYQVQDKSEDNQKLLQGNNCDQVKNNQLLSSLVEEDEVKDVYVQTQETSPIRVDLVERGTPSTDDFPFNNGIAEILIDLSEIKDCENSKFEELDTKYNFSKQKVPSYKGEYSENKLFVDQKAICLAKIIKPEPKNALTINPTLQDLKMKIESLTEIVSKGFIEVKNDIAELPNQEMKPSIVSNSFNLNNVQVTHYGVSCDCCRARPIRGKRFKCLICPDFDICPSCEDSNIHPHPMMIFYNQINISFAEEMTTLCRLKSNINSIEDKELKIRLLRNIVGDKYEANFYENFAKDRQQMNISNFINEVYKIFG
jgi:hypothetical protein